MNKIAGVVAFLIALIGAPAMAAEPPAPKVVPAIDGVLEAFKTHPIVGLGEQHGLAEMGAFYAALVRDPRFAEEVGNLVVETGASAHQDTMDRYVAGETVPFSELREVWGDTVGWAPTPLYEMNLSLFATVRAVNKGLPPDKRIKVWLGEPPIDWKMVKTRADWQVSNAQRDASPAGIIDREILAKGRKALVIYGGAHFLTKLAHEPPRIRGLVEAKHPNSFFGIFPFTGFRDPACTAKLETALPGVTTPALLISKDGAPTLASHRAGCLRNGFPALDAPYEMPEEAMLYLGPPANLMRSAVDETFLLDQTYFDEILRRYQIITGKPYDWNLAIQRIGAGPQRFLP